jgi:hypothetical protein
VAEISVALVTPSFHQVAFLGAAIVSVLGQNCPNLAYAVVDGGSTDGSAEVIARHAGRLAWSVSEKDSGQYDAINKGFQRVGGEVMGWLNSDDLHCPWTLAVVTDLFATFPEVEWLTTRFPLRWDAAGRATHCADGRGYARAAFARGEYCGGTDGFFAAPIQQESTFWRRSLWERTGGQVPTGFGAAGDFALWCRFAREAELFTVSVPLAGFRSHGVQQTVTARAEYFQQARRALDEHFPSGSAPALAKRLRPWVRDRLPCAFYPLAKALGLVFDAPVITRTRDNLSWRIDRVPV